MRPIPHLTVLGVALVSAVALNEVRTYADPQAVAAAIRAS